VQKIIPRDRKSSDSRAISNFYHSLPASGGRGFAMPIQKKSQTELNAAIDQLRREGASIDGDNAYKRDLLDSAVGAMTFGVQDRHPPPPGHWAQRFWDIGREERALSETLLVDLREAAATLRRYETLHRAKGTDDSIAKAEVNAALASRFEATIAKATE
jgi:hypothetical protein